MIKFSSKSLKRINAVIYGRIAIDVLTETHKFRPISQTRLCPNNIQIYEYFYQTLLNWHTKFYCNVSRQNMIIREKLIAPLFVISIFYLNVRNVSGLLRSGWGVYFLTFITFKRFEIFYWNLAGQYTIHWCSMCGNLTEIKCLDTKLFENYT